MLSMVPRYVPLHTDDESGIAGIFGETPCLPSTACSVDDDLRFKGHAPADSHCTMSLLTLFITCIGT